MSVTVWILGDQLIKDHPAILKALQDFPRQDITVLMVESAAQTSRLPYHAKKIVLLFSAMRHYAEELRSGGFQVDYRAADVVEKALSAHLVEYQPSSIFTMQASSVRGRKFQETLNQRLNIPTVLVPNTQFLCEQYAPMPDATPDQFIRQEQFYRKMRGHFGVLMDDAGQPVGDKWNYDQKNRKPLPPSLETPDIIHFNPDSVTQSVIDEVSKSDSRTGTTAEFDLAVTPEQANQAVEDFLNQRLPNFGTYEDGMRQSESVLFHSKLAAYLNIGLLEPLDLVRAAEQCYHDGTAAINNVEGFIRQVIGWREYMYWQYHRLMPGLAEGNYFEMVNPIPSFFWNPDQADMNCLRTVIERVLTLGYTHHIERLMVLSNFCLLAGITPSEVCDWFSSAFIDAYEWVMVPNVYGMGLFADGGKIGTKPYIASANYINRMSDYCQDCAYDKNQRTGSQACPYNTLYWNFLLSHRNKLEENPRMARMLSNLRFLDEDERTRVQNQADDFLADFF